MKLRSLRAFRWAVYLAAFLLMLAGCVLDTLRFGWRALDLQAATWWAMVQQNESRFQPKDTRK